MIFYIIHKILGSWNSLKKKYDKTNNKYYRRIIRFIGRYYDHECSCSIPIFIKSNGTINFIHSYYGIFISGSAKIGDNLTIYQNVTIGSVMQIDSRKMGAPTICNDVIIGAGAKIVGKITIGNNCRIAPNAFVNFDVPDNSIVIDAFHIITKDRKLINRVYEKGSDGWNYHQSGKKILEQDKEFLNKIESSLETNKG